MKALAQYLLAQWGIPIGLAAVVFSIWQLIGCSSSDTAGIKVVQDVCNANTAAIKALTARVDALTADITALKARIATLEKQAADLGNKQNTLATKAELTNLQNAVPNVTDLKQRLAQVEGQLAQLKSQQATDVARMNQAFAVLQESVKAATQGTPQQLSIETLKAQVADLQARLASHGW